MTSIVLLWRCKCGCFPTPSAPQLTGDRIGMLPNSAPGVDLTTLPLARVRGEVHAAGFSDLRGYVSRTRLRSARFLLSSRGKFCFDCELF
jgi:hypothetical protein